MTNCEIIKDLLPLYKDEVVSASSIEMIEEHLKTCANCKAELDKLQGEVKVSFSPEQKAEISALKLFKKKIFRKNVVVACISVVLAVALIFGAYLYLDNSLTVIPYTDGLIVGVNAYPDRGIIDVVSSVKPEGWDVSSVMINENGENVKLMFMSFSESVISRWQNNRNGHIEYSFQVLQPMDCPQPNPEDKPGANLIYEPFDRCEIYYINEMSEIIPERDYQELRHEGVLLWSGTLEDVYEPIIDANPIYNLTNSGKLTANTPDISDYWLYTNSGKISVSVSGDVVDKNACITLYDTNGMNDIMVMQINPNRMTGVFTNLTAARNYFIVVTGLDGCEITLSD